ncbi:MAG TPA: type II secretion system protein GspE [Serratia grimesii]|uniref:Type II secretion system protein E n=1 Tax=Serratia grimesii TaxID=82995 RepID=A0A9C7QWD5_9GAMM|nr:type II secretion system ATPase GspE [Serratia grimesii]HCK00069.1 type II secretion system protein GspE [Serratia grimesii]
MDAPPLPFAWAQQQGVLYRFQEQQHQLVFRTGASVQALLEARRVLPPCMLVPLDADTFEQALLNHYQQGSDQARQMMEELGNDVDFYHLVDSLPQDDDLLADDDGAPIVRMINAMLAEAIKEGASDIHIEPFERSLAIRFRIDGVLRPILSPPRQLAPVLVSRIKVMAKLDIAEKRLPQDGRIALRIGGRAIDVRVSTLPASHGERVVLRLLDKNAVKLDLGHLGLNDTKRQSLGQLISNPHGIILVTGPTGSGKSTTLYAALNQLNSQERNIMTVEDPVEYELEGIGQTQVNPRVDMTFARGLHAILRQDPDVVMIGEIRDADTAQIAVQASLTGHLVLSTLHTNSALGAVGRLRDMGVEPFLLASSLIGVVAQRLVRRLCGHCRQPATPDDALLQQVGLAILPPQPWSLYQPVGCERCNFSGYRGRTGIHELLTVDDELRQAIARGASESALEPLARRHSQGLRHDGLEKAFAGHTSLEEVLRVTREN